jgi:hypothetical protein
MVGFVGNGSLLTELLDKGVCLRSSDVGCPLFVVLAVVVGVGSGCWSVVVSFDDVVGVIEFQ